MSFLNVKIHLQSCFYFFPTLHIVKQVYEFQVTQFSYLSVFFLTLPIQNGVQEAYAFALKSMLQFLSTTQFLSITAKVYELRYKT